MINIKNLQLSFGEKIIFRNLDLQVKDNARIGLVGVNGAGKTTLLRIITGELESDSGIIERSKNLTVGYLPQDLIELEPVPLMQYLRDRAGLSQLESRLRDIENKLAANPDNHEALLNEHSRLEHKFESIGGFAFESEAHRVLHGLGFTSGDSEKNCLDFSGGWQMRIAIAALLLALPDVLLLDEPTNHLDLYSMEWLEGWLANYRGAVLAVSHDTRFLENVAENIADLTQYKINLYKCGYDEYLELKAQNEELLEKAYNSQQRELHKIESFINRFRYKATKAAQVQSRIKQLEKIKLIELNSPDKSVKINIPESEPSGLEVIKVTNLAKNYDDLKVFEGINFVINRSERVALVGINGAGKSTLLRLLSLSEQPSDGKIKFGHNVKFAYYSQLSAQNINYNNTVWEEAQSVPSRLNAVERRNLLGAFLFSGEDIYKSVKVLSGGEKARLALYKLMLTETNLLILDEPTNHLDFNTREIIERALLKYQGTLIIVSHDRHFLDSLAERVLELRDGSLYDYPGNYSYYLEKRVEREENLAGKTQTHKSENKAARQNNSASHNQEIRVKKKLIAELEKNIAISEQRVGEIDSALCSPEVLNNSNRIKELMIERDGIEKLLKSLYADWEEASMELEELKN